MFEWDSKIEYRVRRKGSSVNLKVKNIHLELISVIRQSVQESGNSLEADSVEIAKLMGSLKPETFETSISMAMEKLMRNKILINPHYNGGWHDHKCYGNTDLIVTGRDGSEIEIPKLYSSDIPEKIRAKYDNLNKYYVYIYKLEGKVIYVGKGIGRRIEHYKSKIEHNCGILGILKSGHDIEAVKIAENLTDEMATNLENAYLLSVLGSGGTLLNRAIPKFVKERIKEK